MCMFGRLLGAIRHLDIYASVLHCTRIVRKKERKKSISFNVIEVIDRSRSSELKYDLPPDLKMNLMICTKTGKNVML